MHETLGDDGRGSEMPEQLETRLDGCYDTRVVLSDPETSSWSFDEFKFI